MAPTQISCFGSCARVVGDHTTGTALLSHASVSHRVPLAVPGRMAPCRAPREIGIRIGVAADRSDRTPSSTSPASASATRRSSATSRRRPTGSGTARTGVTTLLLAEDAYLRPLAAGGAVLNGAGECTGFLTASEWGAIETPVYLTSTMQLGRVYDAACEIALEQHAERRRRRGDPGGRRVRRLVPQRLPARCRSTLPTSARPTTRRLGSRGGHLAAGRGRGRRRDRDVLPGLQGRHRYGVPGDRRRAHGRRCCCSPTSGSGKRLTVAGVPVGRLLPRTGAPSRHHRPGRASASSSPTRPSTRRDCARLARRIGLGLARTGSTAHHGSGEIFLAASTTCRVDRDGTPERGTAGRRPRASTRCSRRWSTPPRRRCSTRCSARRRRSAATATPARGSTRRAVSPAAGRRPGHAGH